MTNSHSDPQLWKGFDILVVSPTPTHPQDHGNRKRFFEYCSELKRQGAKVHFVHYASEHDWRHRRPAKYEKEMIAAWDSYQLVAPSRPLHEASQGADHLMDEWSDPALTNYIKWAFTIHRYDLVIVGYTWMSFCLEAVPDGVFRICDTHDVFSGRRAILEANGISPEFFHTTSDEEAKGLARAHLVWAIKKSEQQYFESELGVKQCLTMLYAEPDRNWWQKPPSTDGWLRAGVLGARNNINKHNLEAFLAIALPVFESFMAPVKIVIAGGCSDDFRDYRHPNLEVIGRVPDVAEFYRSMDVICAPMQFSTGLKIKVAEALASGAPLVCLEHAMEGYPATDPLHVLQDFTAMASELVKLSFDPSGLVPLAARSRIATKKIRASVLETLDATRRLYIANNGNSICVVAPLEAFDERGLLYDQLYATLNYLRFAARITLFIVGKPVKFNAELLKHHGFDVRVFVEPGLYQALGDVAPEVWTPLDFDQVFSTRGIDRAYFLCEVPRLEMIGPGVLRRAFVRYDAVLLSGGDPSAIIDLLKPMTSVVVLSAAIQGLADEGNGVVAVCQVPYRRKNAFTSLSRRLEVSGHWRGLLILAEGNDPLIAVLDELAARLDVRSSILDIRDATAIRHFACPSDGVAPQQNITGARIVVDLSSGSPVASVVSEGARRAGIPVVRLIRGTSAAVFSQISTLALPTTDGALLRIVASGLRQDDYYDLLLQDSLRESSSLAINDVGWTWLWQDLTRNHLTIKQVSAVDALFR